jgi:hypothetical protein
MGLGSERKCRKLYVVLDEALHVPAFPRRLATIFAKLYAARGT